MAEATANFTELGVSTDKKVKKEETGVPKRKLFDALLPPQNDVQKIKSLIDDAQKREFGETPHREISRVFGVVTDIFLWQNMLAPNKGDILPAGLTLNVSPQTLSLEDPRFYLDTQILTMQDYRFLA